MLPVLIRCPYFLLMLVREMFEQSTDVKIM